MAPMILIAGGLALVGVVALAVRTIVRLRRPGVEARRLSSLGTVEAHRERRP